MDKEITWAAVQDTLSSGSSKEECFETWWAKVVPSSSAEHAMGCWLLADSSRTRIRSSGDVGAWQGRQCFRILLRFFVRSHDRFTDLAQGRKNHRNVKVRSLQGATAYRQPLELAIQIQVDRFGMAMDLNRRLSQGPKVTGAEGKEYLKKRQIERVVCAYASGRDMTRFCIGIGVIASA